MYLTQQQLTVGSCCQFGSPSALDQCPLQSDSPRSVAPSCLHCQLSERESDVLTRERAEIILEVEVLRRLVTH